MNPQMLMAFMPMLMQMFQGGNMGGKNAEYDSTYGKGAQDTLQDIQNQVKSMGKQGAGDITQNQNYQTGQDWLQSMFNDPSFFNKFEAPMMRQYEEQTIPDLANRFAGMGSGGSMGSTGFRNQATREAGNLQTNLAALRGGMQQQAIPQLAQYAQQPTQNYMQMLNQAMTPTQNQYKPATAGPFGELLAALTGGMASGYGQQWGQSMAPGGGSTGSSLPTNVSLSRQYPGQ